MTTRLDPRAWNLLAGLSLAAGACSTRSVGSDDATGTGDDTESGETDSSSSETDTGGPECTQDGDCPPGYYCEAYSCQYQGSNDGHSGYDCYEPDDCDVLEVCSNDHDCEPVPVFLDCAPNREPSIPLAVDGVPLALSFVDVDADGARELAVATQTELHVFESGSDIATVSARVNESATVTAMVAGDFDPGPGQDLVLLVADTLLTHPADGIAGFAPPSEGPSPELDSAGMLAGEFDGVAPSDLLVWGAHATSVIAGEVSTLYDSQPPTVSAAAHDLSSGSGRFVLRVATSLNVYTLDGMLLTNGLPMPSEHVLVTAITHPEHFDLGSTGHTSISGESWTLVELWDLGQLRGQWSVLGTLSAMTSGDLDGDSHDEVAIIHQGGGVTVLGNIHSGNECARALELGGLTGPTHLAIGDHDGDGDDELAISFASGALAMFDGEG
jgi:hypothetical protein